MDVGDGRNDGEGRATNGMLTIGNPDREGRTTLEIYAQQTGRYAVYRTAERVQVRLADDPLVQTVQRRRLAPLACLRSEIDGSLTPWRRAKERWRVSDAAEHYDGRVASALTEALEGNGDNALAILRQVRGEIACERTSRARLYYLACTIGVAAVFLLVCMAALGVVANRFAATADIALAVWFAVTTGVLGAVYSMALAIRKRDVSNDRRWADHITDATVRICIGALAAFVIAEFLLTGAIQISFGDVALPDAPPRRDGLKVPSVPVMLLAGFLAGFAERFVPDLLNTYATRAAPGDGGEGAPPVAPAPAPPGPAAAVASAPGTAAIAADPGDATAAPTDEEAALVTPPAEDEDVDGCVVDLAAPEHVTADEDLPAASGGVQRIL